MKTVLITGAAGDVGMHLRRELAGGYRLRTSDRRPLAPAKGERSSMKADVSKMADALRITQGVDAIVHLAGYSVEGPWPAILQANIVGCYNIFEAAQRNGVSKVFGEALGSLYADKYGLQVLMIRIGNVNPAPLDKRRLSIWCSPRDLAQLVSIGIEHPDIGFEIVYGVSGNPRSWYDNSNAVRLGYRPQDDSEVFAAEVLAREKPGDPRAEAYQGGPFVHLEEMPLPGATRSRGSRRAAGSRSRGARSAGSGRRRG